MTLRRCSSEKEAPILLVTNKQDITTDYLVHELRRRGSRFLRLNTEDLPETIITFEDADTLTGTLNVQNTQYNLAEFRGAYYRRPELPQPKLSGDSEVDTYVIQEWSSAARSLWNALEGRWLNSPFNILRAEDKPRQLAVARSCGLSVPPTAIGNDMNAAKNLLSNHRCIIKPLRRALVDDPNGPGRVIYTSEIQSLNEADRIAFEAVPVIVQAHIQKHRDLRVTIVDQIAIAVAIHSQDHEETRVDWRRGSRTDLVNEHVSLPPSVASACIEVVRNLNLRFAAIDLIEDCEGKYWFLEANPNGQWAWLQQVEGIDIAATIADALCK